jgi:DNA-binding transcriptional LysR family regulator
MKNLSFDWNELKFFLAVARSGGLSGAATVLGTSASTVSRHIDALERRIGRKLFLRQQSGYTLTDEGNELLAQAGQVEQAMAVAAHAAHRPAQQEVSGVVRLATTEMLAQYLVAPRLAALRTLHPALRVELDIAMGAVNLSRREADDGAGDYIAKRIGKVDFALYSAAEVPHDRDDYISWDGAWDGLPMAASLRASFDGVPPVLACNSLPTQIAAARAGVGAAMLPCFIGDAEPALLRTQRQAAPVSRDLWLVCHRDLKASLRVQAMAAFLTKVAGVCHARVL